MEDFVLLLQIHNLVVWVVVVGLDKVVEEHFEEVDWMEEGHILVVVGNHLVEVEDNFVVEDLDWDMVHHWVEHHTGLVDFEEVHQDQEDMDQEQD